MENYFIYLEVTDSTNNELKRRLDREERPREFTVVSAGAQTAGRGRSGHEWVSPAGVCVATSMLCYPPESLPEEAVSGLTILAAVAVTRAIEQEFSIPARIKWPNDVLIKKRKVCGILTERVEEAVIIGIGLNLKRGSYPVSLADRATSIEEELYASESEGASAADFWKLEGSMEDNERKEELHARLSGQVGITEKIWEHFRSLYDRFLRERSLSFLLHEYNDKLINRDAEVLVLDPAGRYEAKSLGTDEAGRLVVVIPETGEKRRIDAGEVRVRGTEGYV